MTTGLELREQQQRLAAGDADTAAEGRCDGDADDVHDRELGAWIARDGDDDDDDHDDHEDDHERERQDDDGHDDDDDGVGGDHDDNGGDDEDDDEHRRNGSNHVEEGEHVGRCHHSTHAAVAALPQALEQLRDVVGVGSAVVAALRGYLVRAGHRL